MQRPVTGNERKQQDTAAVLFRDKAGMADYGERYYCKPCNRVFTQALAGKQVDAGTYGIRPTDKTEDSPPARMERFSVEVFINNQSCEQYHACHFHYGEKGFFCAFGFGIYSPCQEETDYHKDSKPGMGKAAFDAAAVKREQSHGDERYRTPEYMRDDLCGSITLFITVLYGKRYRHAHAEQESREDGIGKSQHVFIDIGVHQPVGDILQSGNVVYKEHEEHGECAEYIYCGNSLEC